MRTKKIYSTPTNIFLLDDLLGDFYNELQSYYDDLFMNYAEDLMLDNSSYFVIDESNSIVGFYSLSPFKPHVLRYLYIKPVYRKMNYGTSIIEKLLNENQTLTLNCSIKNKNGIKFYDKFNGSKSKFDDEVTYKLKL